MQAASEMELKPENIIFVHTDVETLARAERAGFATAWYGGGPLMSDTKPTMRRRKFMRWSEFPIADWDFEEGPVQPKQIPVSGRSDE